MHFVGAGPGAADLLTLRAADQLAAADVVLYPGTYLDEGVLGHCSAEATLIDTQRLDLDQIVGHVLEAYDAGLDAVRLVSGDPSVYSALAEQTRRLDVAGVAWEVTPGPLERGLQVELSDHLGYENGDPDASAFPDSRNGSTPKTTRPGSARSTWPSPATAKAASHRGWCPRAAGGSGGWDEMIISLYAGGMTVRDIEHHLASTLSTELSAETISDITDQVGEGVLVWQQRPLDALYR